MSYARFPTTQWSMLDRMAGMGNSAEGSRALDRLLRRYLPALKAHLLYDRGLDPNAAEDLLQEFVLSKVLEKGALNAADQNRGRFRTYLLSILDRFVIDHHRRSAARQRRMHTQDIDEAVTVIDQHPVPSRAFDLTWAKAVIEQAVEAAHVHFQSTGRQDLWLVLKYRVLDPILQDKPPPPYEQMVKEFGFKTASQACSAVLTARRGFAGVLRQVVAQYVPDEAVEDEIALLQQALSSAG